MKVDIKLPPFAGIQNKLGITKGGRVQTYLTHEIRRRMTRYMPYRTGTTATKLTFVDTPTTIVVNAPYARYLYYGVSKNGNALNYTKDFNKQAGPFWDRTLMANEGKKIEQAVENYIRRMP